MSNAYYLVCMDCKSGVLLGKTTFAKFGSENTYSFDQFGFQGDEQWVQSYNNIIDVQHFMMLHRTHELRVLPDTVDRYATDIGVPHTSPGFDDDTDPLSNRLIFLDSDVGTPDPESEANNLPNELVEKLKRF